MQQYQLNVPSIGPMVKKLMIINVVIWVVLVLIVQNIILNTTLIYEWFALTPLNFTMEFQIWTPITYMFLHASSIGHILINMLVLWMFGSELEARWGSRFFITYYFVCGVGAALLYSLGAFIYYGITKDFFPLHAPVIGASGAIFGLTVAYGIVFSERVVHFMLIFPMKAKTMAMLIAGIAFISTLQSGFGSNVAHVAHLAGAVVGYVYLKYGGPLGRVFKGKSSKSRGRKLKLVVNNDDSKAGPKYWN